MPTIVIVGASPDPSRYSHQAVIDYAAAGWTVIPLHPTAPMVAGVATIGELSKAPIGVEIVVFYVKPSIGLTLLSAVVALRPLALWLNPGADGEEIANQARALGLPVIEACSLVAVRVNNPLAMARAAHEQASCN